MSETKKSLINKQVIIASIVFSVVLCMLTLFFQIFVSVALDNGRTYFQLEITPFIEKPLNDEELDEEMSQLNITQTPMIAGVMGIGMRATVVGTDGKGLRMRESASFDSNVLFLAQDGEQVEIIEGPIIEDSIIWWKIASIQDSQKIGWSVQDYLIVE